MANLISKKIFNSFNYQITKSFSLIKSMEGVGSTKINSKLQIKQAEFYEIVELSFIKIFIAWEQFLEAIFIRHLVSRGNSRVKSYINAKSLNHAYQIVKENRPYPDWTNRDTVLRKANLFLKNGEPYKTTLNSISSDLEDIKTIRNSIVHMSNNSQEKLKSLIRSSLSMSPSGISAGKFLLNIKNKPGENYIEHYSNILISAAKDISKF